MNVLLELLIQVQKYISILILLAIRMLFFFFTYWRTVLIEFLRSARQGETFTHWLCQIRGFSSMDCQSVCLLKLNTSRIMTHFSWLFISFFGSFANLFWSTWLCFLLWKSIIEVQVSITLSQQHPLASLSVNDGLNFIIGILISRLIIIISLAKVRMNFGEYATSSILYLWHNWSVRLTLTTFPTKILQILRNKLLLFSIIKWIKKFVLQNLICIFVIEKPCNIIAWSKYQSLVTILNHCIRWVYNVWLAAIAELRNVLIKVPKWRIFLT
jgi:hypothetical protein